MVVAIVAGSLDGCWLMRFMMVPIPQPPPPPIPFPRSLFLLAFFLPPALRYRCRRYALIGATMGLQNRDMRLIASNLVAMG